MMIFAMLGFIFFSCSLVFFILSDDINTDLLGTFFFLFSKKYDLVKILNDEEKSSEILYLSEHFSLSMDSSEVSIIDCDTKQVVYPLIEKRLSEKVILNKKSFKSCGKFQNEFWDLFKKAYTKKLDSLNAALQLEQNKKDEEIRAKLHVDAKESETSPECEQFNKLVKEILNISYDTHLSNELRKALVDIYETARDIKDKSLVRKLNNFYFPELKQLMSKYLENKNNKEIKDKCEKIVFKFAKCLKEMKENYKDKKMVIETVALCSSFENMMEIDGLIPDKTKEK